MSWLDRDEKKHTVHNISDKSAHIFTICTLCARCVHLCWIRRNASNLQAQASGWSSLRRTALLPAWKYIFTIVYELFFGGIFAAAASRLYFHHLCVGPKWKRKEVGGLAVYHQWPLYGYWSPCRPTCGIQNLLYKSATVIKKLVIKSFLRLLTLRMFFLVKEQQRDTKVGTS